jgi:hypothetical protein
MFEKSFPKYAKIRKTRKKHGNSYLTNSSAYNNFQPGGELAKGSINKMY